MREKFFRNGERFSPAQIYARAKLMADETVRLRELSAVNKTEAIRQLSREHGLGSFLRKLVYRESVVMKMHLYAALCQCFEEEIEQTERRIAGNRAVLSKLRSDDALVFAGLGAGVEVAEGARAAG